MKLKVHHKSAISKNKTAVSPAISTVIITSITIVLVLVASTYAYQILERSRGAAEFSTAKKAVMAINDAVENIAWKQQSSRSTHFVASYGILELIPNALNLTVNVQVGANSQSTSFSTGIIKYSTKIDYVNYGNGYKEYIIGNESAIVSRSSESFGQALIEQQSDWIDIKLDFRACAMKTREENVGGTTVTYVDVWIITLEIANRFGYKGEFDVTTRCKSVTATSIQFNTLEGQTAVVSASFGEEWHSWTTPPLRSGVVVFNFIVSTVEVTV
ncbi:MAG: hypothetical protein ACP5IM_01785 [Candidatus Bathyarchaeia archaeon]